MYVYDDTAVYHNKLLSHLWSLHWHCQQCMPYGAPNNVVLANQLWIPQKNISLLSFLELLIVLWTFILLNGVWVDLPINSGWMVMRFWYMKGHTCHLRLMSLIYCLWNRHPIALLWLSIILWPLLHYLVVLWNILMDQCKYFVVCVCGGSHVAFKIP